MPGLRSLSLFVECRIAFYDNAVNKRCFYNLNRGNYFESISSCIHSLPACSWIYNLFENKESKGFIDTEAVFREVHL